MLASEAFDWREVFVLAAEMARRRQPRFLFIIRTDAGGFFGFGESDLPEFDNFKGRFTGILPPNPPAPEMRARARLLLKAMGVKDDDLMEGESRWSYLVGPRQALDLAGC